MSFNGIGTHLGNLYRTSSAQSRSICAENPTGSKGGGAQCELVDGVSGNNARDLGKGWKVNPYVILPAKETTLLADIEGPGCIQHIWVTSTGTWREQILRIYWDNQTVPSVECPLGDFFACGWERYAPISSLAVCVNPGSAFNSYWQMPFKERCRITIENRGDNPIVFFYQIDYCLTELEDDIAYFHAQFRRTNPLPYKEEYKLLDNVQGKGQYVGTYMCWGVNNNGWWGEGECKFYLDGDTDYPTICGTGTEDYFCGSYNYEAMLYKRKSVKDEKLRAGEYQVYTTPYAGLSQVILPDGCYSSQQRFGMYRWHIVDPIRFESDIRITVQALGWRADGRYLPLQDDISSVAFWYQTLPTVPFPELPNKDYLEVI
ncbi:MAG TPA: DUF2961 domain-containing protein [Sphaerochaeta sp.]|nr:DUF2961 domain-containing protein [Sphaerochaeta sp.]HQB90097.1 DUF2961 domain-containing protein [Sphaerochaeta sp.]